MSTQEMHQELLRIGVQHHDLPAATAVILNLEELALIRREDAVSIVGKALTEFRLA